VQRAFDLIDTVSAPLRPLWRLAWSSSLLAVVWHVATLPGQPLPVF
jgi:hypothetical protein